MRILTFLLDTNFSIIDALKNAVADNRAAMSNFILPGKMMKSKFMVLTFLLGVSLTLNTQNFDKQKLDSLFSIIVEYEKGMGSISIFQNEKEVYPKSYGYADLENKVRNNASTKFRNRFDF